MNVQWKQFPNLKAYSNPRWVDMPLKSVKPKRNTKVKNEPILNTYSKKRICKICLSCKVEKIHIVLSNSIKEILLNSWNRLEMGEKQIPKNILEKKISKFIFSSGEGSTTLLLISRSNRFVVFLYLHIIQSIGSLNNFIESLVCLSLKLE